MKNIKYFITLLLTVGFFNSCVDMTSDLDSNDAGKNLAGFHETRQVVTAIADGVEYTHEVKVRLYGPTVSELTEDVEVTIAADASSTAIAGTHFKIDNAKVVLKKSENYLATFKFKMLTQGIITPLAVAPVVVFKATATSGHADKVTFSGKTIPVTLNYACPSSLEGTYAVTVDYFRAGAKIGSYTFDDVITKTGIGQYRTGRVGHWAAADLGGTPGFTFYDVCGVISIPEQNLVNLYSNMVKGLPGKCFVDPANPSKLIMEYTIIVPPATSDRQYLATYVKK